ncbi:4Fe-4S dicluster domain-containing protein [Rhodoblastus acidophilus]|uniref:4Fe-4S dicluster domain-containing protein n=1 Tax=Candidatus Rhodoblastus alkanivorans TaxID=2954117 RepID=A0ABS9Z8U5_9HYPH|nr:4Fe-4S dicluster domain-containing protein [Candidatus Rhodoblastus alkanivorans]MCI4680335.1 4Fe-4S dicluster domain-containing protein [Candidatus Rhodoblastus alkanivorans]MCI4684012.1 4Fe-4S dicluster domain-containing protein [Candidatus Rhodoblastus alkanivorans]MDI4641331.1 4Fe-4S dicluster domain-containing protein [Rhodoblastus acidophilus]
MSSCSRDDDKAGVDRRGLLQTAGAFAATVLAPGVTLYAFGGGEARADFAARPPQDPASPKQRWGMLIDLNKCSKGCNACVTACKDYNGWQDTGNPADDPQWIRKVTLRDPNTGFERSAPVMCQHCAEPPCVDVCPTGASMKRADGIVLVNKHTCIGCRYCMMACPFKARSFIAENETDQKVSNPSGKGTVEGCTLCVNRIDAGQSPACVEACAKEGGALLFGDLNDPNSEVSKALRQTPTTQLRADLKVSPAINYANL